MKPRLLLFDIDGTILDCGGTGPDAVAEGFLDAFDLHERRAAMPELVFAGATDALIARQLFAAFEIADTPDHRERFFSAYATRLRSAISQNGGRARILPGVQQLLNHFADAAGQHLGLLTGNIETGARIKLDHVGVEADFEFGAFGDDAEHRDELGPIALERARRHTGEAIEPDQAVVIGDTPRDVSCARAAGMKVVAVATGRFSLAELERCEPDAALENLEDFDRTAELIRVI